MDKVNSNLKTLHCIYLASFLACIEESISEREGKQFEEGLNSKVKLDM